MTDPTPTPAPIPHPTATAGADPTPTGGPAPTSEQYAWYRARRAVRALRFWYLHLAVYLAVNTLIWSKYLILGPSQWAGHHHPGPGWPLGPTLGWGLIVAIHGLLVWSRVSRRGQAWEDRKVREYLARG